MARAKVDGYRDVGDFMMVTASRCCWHKHYVKDFFYKNSPPPTIHVTIIKRLQHPSPIGINVLKPCFRKKSS